MALTELRKLKVKTVGLVDSGANDRTFAIVKSALPFADLPVVDEEPPEKTDAQLIDDILGPDGDNFEAMDAAHLWRDDAAIEARDGEKTRGDYKLPIADITDGTLTVYYSKLTGALAALNGARGGVDIPIDDAERAFSIGVRYVRKLNESLPDDEQKPIPEFTGADMAEADEEVEAADEEVEAQEEGEEVAEVTEPEVAEAEPASEFPALQAVVGERLKMAEGLLDKLKGFATMSKDDVNEAFWALDDALWGARGDVVSLAKSADVTIRKRNQEGQMADQTEKSAEVVALEKAHTDELTKRDERITALETSVAKANDKTRLGELVSMAKSDFPSLGDSEAIAKSLQTIEKASTEAFDAQVEVLKGAEAKAKAGLDNLLKTNGRPTQPDEGSASHAIQKRAGELMEAGTVDTIEKATLWIAKNEPRLITAQREEEA